MKVGDTVRVVRGPLGGYRSPNEDAWPGARHGYETDVSTGDIGAVIGRLSLPGWWIVQFAADDGDRFVPCGEGHVERLAW